MWPWFCSQRYAAKSYGKMYESYNFSFCLVKKNTCWEWYCLISFVMDFRTWSGTIALALGAMSCTKSSTFEWMLSYRVLKSAAHWAALTKVWARVRAALGKIRERSATSGALQISGNDLSKYSINLNFDLLPKLELNKKCTMQCVFDEIIPKNDDYRVKKSKI